MQVEFNRLAPIQPLVFRHAEDAAFYWMQIDSSLDSYSLKALRVHQFSELLKAHLDGLKVAGPVGTKVALDALSRWRKPGEAFAAMHAALGLPRADATEERARDHAIHEVFKVVRQDPELMLRGVISALAWNPVDETLLRSLYAGDAVQKVAALRASALRGDAVADWHTHAHSDSPWVRAAACRAASAEHIGWLDEFASDTDLCVRAESVLAWKRLAAPSDLTSPLAVQASSRLWQCVSAQLQVLGNSSGWNRIQAQRRLARWIRHLARLAPLGHPGIPQLLDRLPPRIALDFLLHHGDADLMPALLTLMRLPDHAQWGGWVWYCLTGVDLRSQGLALKDQVGSAEDVTAPQTNPSDIGLPFPDVDAIARHPASQIRLPEGERLLQGYALHPKRLRSLLDPSSNQPQTLRAFAAEALGDLYPEYTLNLRARQDEQDEVLARMGVAV